MIVYLPTCYLLCRLQVEELEDLPAYTIQLQDTNQIFEKPIPKIKYLKNYT